MCINAKTVGTCLDGGAPRVCTNSGDIGSESKDQDLSVNNSI